MRFYTTQHQFYCGIDLHARMVYVCILDQSGELLVHRSMKTDLHTSLKTIEALRADQLWMEDRNFCTLGLMVGRHRRGAVFVVRQHGQLQGELRGRAKRTGTTRRGPVYEQAMQERDPTAGEMMRLRRLTIKLKVPTRDGDTEFPILLQWTERAGLGRWAGSG